MLRVIVRQQKKYFPGKIPITFQLCRYYKTCINRNTHGRKVSRLLIAVKSVVIGQWSLVINNCCWLWAVGCWLLAVGCWLLAVGSRLQAPGSRLPTPGSRLRAISYHPPSYPFCVQVHLVAWHHPLKSHREKRQG